MIPPYIITPDASAALTDVLSQANADRIYVLVDSGATMIANQILAQCGALANATRIDFQPSETKKSIASAEKIWEVLSGTNATRKSLIVNIGGGITTDLGGFAAALFKRGIRYVNIPTTLLAAIDASLGGKTAVNFAGLKNEIGAFANPLTSIVSASAFESLPDAEWYAGFAEMLKTAYISEPSLPAAICHPEELRTQPALLAPELERALKFKLRITQEDPREGGVRRILNFGHTAGHAFESLCMERGRRIPHGAAVAHGILVALILSHFQLGLPSEEAQKYASAFLKPYYPVLPIDCRDYPQLLNFMTHDKKNDSQAGVAFVLLRRLGEAVAGCHIRPDEITAALDIYRDLAQ